MKTIKIKDERLDQLKREVLDSKKKYKTVQQLADYKLSKKLK